MRILFSVTVFLVSLSSFSQKSKVLPKNYPSLFWEISGNGLSKPSYLFGTMHVSNKMVFHLSDSFYLGIRSADVVALETDMGSWQEDFSKYDLAVENYYDLLSRSRRGVPSDYFTIGTLQFPAYEKMIELALYNNPSTINNFLYRSSSDKASDFEEDTYLDLHIYQAGKKWGKKVCGVEKFGQSMQLMKEAYLDAAKEKDRKEKSYDFDGDFSYARMEDAYRSGNLDLLDTINKVNSSSAAFDEKFLYKRNEIQANSIDSIIRNGSRLFVGVGAAHLPGQRGVIELLRKKGYKLRPIKMTEKNSRYKDEVEKIRVPVQFSKQTSADGFLSVSMPGKLYDFAGSLGMAQQQQYADMTNGSYYMITRIQTNMLAWGHNEDMVIRKIDSVIYENIPGKILSKHSVTKNGYKGIEVMNRTRRGDFQRYNIFVTPFEIILFKMSGNGDYVQESKEANQFFSSIELKTFKNEWKKWSPSSGGFEVELPHQPVVSNDMNWHFMARDLSGGTGFEVIRTDVHNYEFVEEDSFDLGLMEESFASSEFIDTLLSKRTVLHQGYPALEAKYRYKDGSVALVKFIIQGPHYYSLLAHASAENPKMKQFMNSFRLVPYVYPQPVKQTDSSLYFTVSSPVQLQKTKKISMYPEELRYANRDEDHYLDETGSYKDRLVSFDSTGEKIYVSFYKPSRYYFDNDTASVKDYTHFKNEKFDWVYRSRKEYDLPNKMKVFEYVLGDPKSSRFVRGKLFTKDGVSYRLEAEGDTLSGQSSFVSNFFSSFAPSDTVKGTNPVEKKSGLFFSDLFSTDSVLHKRSLRNVRRLDFDSSDLERLKAGIRSLSWKEKKYMDVKKNFIWQFSSIPTKESADFLKETYYASGDTLDLQYSALEALLMQETSYAFQVFRDIMIADPPVLEVNNSANSRSYALVYTKKRAIRNYLKTFRDLDIDYNEFGRSSFFDYLSDSIELTSSIFKGLLPLINIHDYEQPIMELMGNLVDSNRISPQDYELYQPKFLIEAKQLLKKQMINEKSKSIEKAQLDDETKNYFNGSEENNGNNQLSLYATLLMPFWDKNPAVKQLIVQLLKSDDRHLKYSTMLLLLRHKKQIPDSMLNYFAGLDEYRYNLYSDLQDMGMPALFPTAFNDYTGLAKSKLFSQNNDYNKPDSIVFIDKLPVTYKDQKGFVYFFKYRQKKDDNGWKLASVGLISSEPGRFDTRKKQIYYEEEDDDFRQMSRTSIEEDVPIKTQLNKALKKMLYSKRNSAARFYSDEDRETMDFGGMNFRD
jgi:uncharacterized protein YbaP (TraB family)